MYNYFTFRDPTATELASLGAFCLGYNFYYSETQTYSAWILLVKRVLEWQAYSA